MPAAASTDRTPNGLVLVAPGVDDLRAGGPWVLIGDWAAAAEQVLGTAVITTPTAGMTAADAHALADVSSRGRAQASGWRRAVPEVAITAGKDLRAWRNPARRQLGAAEKARLDRLTFRPPFVWQYHWLFEERGLHLSRHWGVPLVVAVDALLVWEAARWGVRRPGWSRLVERVGELAVLRHASVITTISDEVAAELTRRDIPASRILVTPNQADPARFAHRDRERFRRAWDVGDRVVVGWVGSFRTFHALDLLIEAFERLAARRDDITLVLVGDGPERAACDAAAARLGPHRMRVVGPLPYEDIPDALGAMDIGVVTARSAEGFHYSPLKLQEYLAAGLAVVAPAVPTVTAAHPDGDDIVLYPAGDVAALDAALVGLADDPALRRRLGTTGRDRLAASGGTAAQLRRVLDHLRPSQGGRADHGVDDA